MLNKGSQDGTNAQQSTEADVTTSDQTIAKHTVVGSTAMNELIQWCILNAFNIEGQDGVKYVAIDYEEMQSQLDYFIKKEKQTLINFHIEVMKQGLIYEDEAKWENGYEPKIREQAEKYYSKLTK